MNVKSLLAQKDKVPMVDVRQHHEWEAGRIPGSVHLPLGGLSRRLGEIDRERPIVTVCRGGPRSAEAAALLSAQGLRADSLEGGILAWAESGLPLMAPDGTTGFVAAATSTAPTPSNGVAVRPEGATIALATGSMRDLELAATVAATAEELGYSTIWVSDEPTHNAGAVAAAMQHATSSIRVGIGPLRCDPARIGTLVAQLAPPELVPDRTALPLGCQDSPPWTDMSLRQAFSDLRGVLGNGAKLGVSPLAEDICRLAGELADVVFLDWMSPERIAWARRCIEQGAELRAGGTGEGPQVVGCVRVAFGPGAALRLAAQAAPYRSTPQYAASFEAMGSAVTGIAAVDPSQAHVLAEPFRALLDETVIRPVATLPTGEAPALGEVFEALSIILEIGHAFAPTLEPAT